MFAQAKCKLPISSQKQNIVAHTTHTQKNKNTKTQKKKLFPLILQTCFTSVPAICTCNIQIANFSQKQESIAHVQKRWESCFTFCLKTLFELVYPILCTRSTRHILYNRELLEFTK